MYEHSYLRATFDHNVCNCLETPYGSLIHDGLVGLMIPH